MTPARPTASVGVRLAGTGMHLPTKVLTNDDLSQFVDTNDEWIVQRTGIRQRHVAENGTTVRELATGSVREALDRAGVAPADLDMLLCATLTPEMCTPSTAARIVDDLGATPAGALDISAACSGFVYGLNMADSLIRTGFYKNVAVVGVETLSKITDWKDRRTCVLFGDGAGAAVLTACDDVNAGCLHQTMHSNGGQWHDLYCPQTEADLPQNGAGREVFSGAFNTLQMNGREVYKFAVTTLQRTVVKALKAVGLEVSDLAMVVAHQSNQRILESARDKLKLPEEKMYINIDRYGNTSAASVPICLHELVEGGRVKQGDLVMFVALGGGLTWASSLWRV